MFRTMVTPLPVSFSLLFKRKSPFKQYVPDSKVFTPAGGKVPVKFPGLIDSPVFVAVPEQVIFKLAGGSAKVWL